MCNTIVAAMNHQPVVDGMSVMSRYTASGDAMQADASAINGVVTAGRVVPRTIMFHVAWHTAAASTSPMAANVNPLNPDKPIIVCTDRADESGLHRYNPH